jgi:hypothetical protein
MLLLGLLGITGGLFLLRVAFSPNADPRAVFSSFLQRSETTGKAFRRVTK